MLASVRWLNRLLAPGDVSPDEAERVLTFAGFPVEGREPLPGGDTRLDVELTSNRGDCLCHIGLAREIAAATGRQLLAPTLPENFGAARGAPSVRTGAALENRTPDACPRFTARVIRGVRVGPSPAWLVEALESVGQRSINNVVDVSNFVLFELGNPSHTFDLDTLRGKQIVVRFAKKGEPFEALDGRTHALRDDELVVADAERAVSLAGVIGGEETSVTTRTKDVLLEVATWAPAVIRRAARRLNIRTDAGHRFERIVDPRTIDFASARLAALILEVAGGELLDGLLDEGAPAPPRTVVTMRASRCRDLIGLNVPSAEMARLLTALDVDAHVDDKADALRCEVPAHRPDLTREADLIEEVARTHGYDKVPMPDVITVRTAPLQPEEQAVREIGAALTGMGFFETVTYSFVAPDEAAMFLPAGHGALRVDEERRKGEPALRPSVLPSLLRCRRVNLDAGVRPEHGVRLFEFGSGYSESAPGKTAETRALALLIDAPDAQRAVREMRGVIEAVCTRVRGADAPVVFAPYAPCCPADRPGATMIVRIGERDVGVVRLFTDAVLNRYGLDEHVVGAEIDLVELVRGYPPRAVVRPLPAFPAIERDLSVVVDEGATWAAIERAALDAKPALLEAVSFVGTYRGKQVGPGRKSVTLRLRFREASRTLRHEEVDPQIEAVVGALRERMNATLRA